MRCHSEYPYRILNKHTWRHEELSGDQCGASLSMLVAIALECWRYSTKNLVQSPYSERPDSWEPWLK